MLAISGCDYRGGINVMSIAVSAFILFFYLITNYLLQLIFYTRRDRRWKLQPVVPPLARAPARVPWLPALVPCGYIKAGAPRLLADGGWVLASINTLLAAAAAGATAEATFRGCSALHMHTLVGVRDWAASVSGFIAAVAMESVLEYYWHRAMHWRWCYRTCHRIHHASKAPSPFDDMLIHPLEALGYYCILYSPAFFIPMHVSAMCAYMAVMGLAGVLDHSGVRAVLPGLYATADHDEHHRLVNVNFSFPFPWLDILHGTYEGIYCGVRYRAAACNSLSTRVEAAVPVPRAAAGSTQTLSARARSRRRRIS